MVVQQRKDHVTVDQDEGIRPGTTAEGLARPGRRSRPTAPSPPATPPRSPTGRRRWWSPWSGRPPTAWRCSPRSWPTGPWPGPTPACTPSRRGPSPTPAGGPGSPRRPGPGRDQRGLRRGRAALDPRAGAGRGHRQRQRRRRRPRPPDRGQRRPGRAHPGHGAAAAAAGSRGRPVRRRRPGRRPAGPGRSLTLRAPNARCGADKRAVARLISWVEDGDRDQLREAAEALNPATGRAQVIGLTGSPGVGKSTLAGALVAAYRPRGDRRGAGRRPVLAVHRRGPARRPGADSATPSTRASTSARWPPGATWAAWPGRPRRRCCWTPPAATSSWSRPSGSARPRSRWPAWPTPPWSPWPPGLGRGPGRQGRHPGGGRRVRGQQGRPRRAEVVARDLRQMLHLGEARPWQVSGGPDRGRARRRVGAGRGRRRPPRPPGVLRRAGPPPPPPGRPRGRGGRPGRPPRRARRARRGEALDTLAEQVAAGKLGPYSAADQLLAGSSDCG